MEWLVDELNLDKFGILGWFVGGVYVFVCVVYMLECVMFVVMVVGMVLVVEDIEFCFDF